MIYKLLSPIFDQVFPKQIMILFSDQYLIIVNKPATVPTQNDKTNDTSLHELLEQETGKKLWLINRIDRPVSGIVIFATSPETTAIVSKQIGAGKIIKTYLAVVENAPPKENDTIVHYLSQNGKTNKNFANVENRVNAQRAELSYRLKAQSDKYFLLEITLHTGRFHQIRAQLAAIGCPIKGDVKYGARRSNEDRSIFLHAYTCAFRHFLTQEQIFITAPLPYSVLWDFFKTKI